VAIDRDLGEPAYHEHLRCWVLFISRYRTLSVIPLQRTPPEWVRWVSVDERHGLQAERVQRLQHLGYVRSTSCVPACFETFVTNS
jgi:hypothetical protein